MISLMCLNEVDPAAEAAILQVGGSVENGTDGYIRVKIPSVLDRRDLCGDGKLCQYPVSDEGPRGFRWVPLFQLESGLWIKTEPYDDNFLTGEHRRRLALCDLEAELTAWISRRENYRAAGGTPRRDWKVGLAPRPWKPEETFIPGVNLEIREQAT